MTKISIETNISDKVAAPAIDRILTRIVAALESKTDLKFDIKANGTTVRLAHKPKLLRKHASRAESIVYDATESGWKVAVLDINGQEIDCRLGGSVQGKAESLAPDEGGLSFESNLELAKQTATQLAYELNLDSRYVSRNADLLDAERALPNFFYTKKSATK